jgi:short subunit dehydrogenase-like uncharacterized protein
MSPDGGRDLDLVLWGATGYTGRLVARYLAERLAAADEPVAWGLGGRDRGKLEAVRAELAALDPGAAGLPLLVGDGLDRASLDPIARRARVVATTVGPYARYGTPLVEACAERGTDYCDLSGEVQWMRRTVDRFHDTAARTGARIVHGCGFDSIPSDLGVLLLHRHLEKRGSGLARARLRVRRMRGKASGGTVATMFRIVEEARRDREVRRVLLDPYALNPPEDRPPLPGGPDRNEGRRPRLDADRGVWTAPFLMAMINTRVVRRSNALLGFPYGRDFRYEERVDTGRGLRGRLRARAVATGLGAFTAAAALPPTAWLLRRLLLPEPGEGPSAEERERGGFRIEILGEGRPVRGGAAGAGAAGGPAETATPRARVTVTADRDPGYGASARMLAESALSLLEAWRGREPLRHRGGVLTPAVALGLHVVSSLARAGIVFEAAPDEDGP